MTSHSLLTKFKISASLMGRKDSDLTRSKKSLSRKGHLNPFFGIGPGIKALNKAIELSGTKIYAYSSKDFILVNGKPFNSIRSCAKALPISPSTLLLKLDTGNSFKGYYYYSKEQIQK